MNRIKRAIRIFSYVVITIGFVGITFCCFHSDKLDVTNYNIKTEKQLNKPFKAAVISDFHHRDLEFANTNLINEIDKLDNLDAIFFTGDLIDAHVKSLDNAFKIFEASKRKTNNLYFVTGNHEEYAPLYPLLRDNLPKYGVTYLDNLEDGYTFEDNNICLYGLKDPRFDTHTYSSFKKDYGKSKEYLDKFKINKNKINILLAHRPELADLYSQYGFDLVVSGHSHGGQIVLGNFSPLVLVHGDAAYSRGEYLVNKTKLIVSAGLGYSAMLPIRINCNPEIVTITINK